VKLWPPAWCCLHSIKGIPPTESFGSVLWKRTWVSSSPRADRVLSTAISTQLQPLMESADEVGECLPPGGWNGSEGSSDPTTPWSGSSKVLLSVFSGWPCIAPACRTLPVASSRELLTFSLWCHWVIKWKRKAIWAGGKVVLMWETCLDVPGPLFQNLFGLTNLSDAFNRHRISSF